MPRKKTCSQNSEQMKKIKTRLIEISMNVDNYIYKQKPISRKQAKIFLNEITNYSTQCNGDTGYIQVIEKLTKYMTIIISSKTNTTNKIDKTDRINSSENLSTLVIINSETSNSEQSISEINKNHSQQATREANIDKNSLNSKIIVKDLTYQDVLITATAIDTNADGCLISDSNCKNLSSSDSKTSHISHNVEDACVQSLNKENTDIIKMKLMKEVEGNEISTEIQDESLQIKNKLYNNIPLENMTGIVDREVTNENTRSEFMTAYTNQNNNTNIIKIDLTKEVKGNELENDIHNKSMQIKNKLYSNIPSENSTATVNRNVTNENTTSEFMTPYANQSNDTDIIKIDLTKELEGNEIEADINDKNLQIKTKLYSNISSENTTVNVDRELMTYVNPNNNITFITTTSINSETQMKENIEVNKQERLKIDHNTTQITDECVCKTTILQNNIQKKVNFEQITNEIQTQAKLTADTTFKGENSKTDFFDTNKYNKSETSTNLSRQIPRSKAQTKTKQEKSKKSGDKNEKKTERNKTKAKINKNSNEKNVKTPAKRNRIPKKKKNSNEITNNLSWLDNIKCIREVDAQEYYTNTSFDDNFWTNQAAPPYNDKEFNI